MVITGCEQCELFRYQVLIHWHHASVHVHAFIDAKLYSSKLYNRLVFSAVHSRQRDRKW